MRLTEQRRHSGKDSSPRLQLATRVPLLWVAAGAACCMEEVHSVFVAAELGGQDKGRDDERAASERGGFHSR